MLLDNQLVLADAQESTLSTSSSSTYNSVSSGDCTGAWFYFRVDTAFAATGTPNARIEIQTSETSDFGGYTVLAASSTYTATTLVSGFEWKCQIPPDVRQYLRGYIDVKGPQGSISITDNDIDDSNLFSAGTFDMAIVKDVDMWTRKYKATTSGY